MTPARDLIIIGAGAAGLMAARAAVAAGYRTVVVDKGRGVGGRLAHRRGDGVGFDHGAQFFTLRDPVLRLAARGWADAGVIRAWSPGDEPRWIGQPGMSAVAKHLAVGLDVRLSWKAATCRHGDGGWTVTGEDVEPLTARWLLITAPVPQALALLGDVDLPDRAGLEAIAYEPCLAALATLAGPSTLPDGGLEITGDPTIRWLADNQRKGVSAGPSATIHSTGAYAAAHYGEPPESVLPTMLAAAAPHLGAAVTDATLHRWRYSRVTSAYPQPCYHAPALGLALAGDGFGGPRVEAALLSGAAAVRALASA
jgi:renalase